MPNLLTRLRPRAQGAPNDDTLKIALLAAASVTPALEKRLLGTEAAVGSLPPSARPEGNLERKLGREIRAQSIAYELHANNGRYSSRADGVAIKNQKELAPHPLMWAVVPVEKEGDAHFFAAAGDDEGARLKQQLFRTLTLPGAKEPVTVALLPLQWEEAKTLQAKHPELVLVEDGQVYRGSSPRSLFVGAQEGQQPKLVGDIEGYSLKMHLSKETYERLGGLGGNRDINANDALFATVLSKTLIEATKDIPLIEVQSEGRAITAKIGDVQVGAIFRKLTEQTAVPGFAFYSATTERLPWVKENDAVRLRATPKPRVLGADAIRFAMQKDPSLTKKDAFVKLFVDPLLDVNFALFARGWSMELHPQNFLLKMDPDTGLVKNVVIRDLHGLAYNAVERKKRGLDDQMSLESLRKDFPAITQADIDGYFQRDGKLRDRYLAPAMFQNSLDFFTTIFWYHLLDGVQADGLFSKDEVTQLVETIKDRMAAKAGEHGFDLASLTQPRGDGHDYWAADKNGVRGRILFRRAQAAGDP